ncbi:MAG TPA: hypothetical protein VGB50_07850 [Flavobacterium sp.]|jgi:hypothetical protein
MIRDFEKKILQKIDFANVYLKEEQKFIKDGSDTPTFKKADILRVFRELGYSSEYIPGGMYKIRRKSGMMVFELLFDIKKNIPLIYLNIYNDNDLLDTGLGHFSYMLNFLPFDKTLINESFGLNSLIHLKDYIQRMISIFDDFVNAYLEEMGTSSI